MVIWQIEKFIVTNGYIKHLMKNLNFQFLSFILQSASNYNTIYTTLLCALENAERNGHDVCVINVYQHLPAKAREIVSAVPEWSKLSKILISIGGFHLLMSFFGVIGNIMQEIGMKEVLSLTYAPKSLEKMLNGHTYARTVRAQTLLQLTLAIIVSKELILDDNMDVNLIITIENLSDDKIKKYFEYELTPYPLSLFSHLLCWSKSNRNFCWLFRFYKKYYSFRTTSACGKNIMIF